MDYTFNYIAGGLARITLGEQDAHWVEVLDAFDHEEANNNRRETRRHVYISTMPHAEDQLIAHEPTPLQVLCRVESAVELMEKLATLTPQQLEMIQMRVDGASFRDIAQHYTLSASSVFEQFS
ncbi:MAG: hypothetical protein LBK46_03490 [Oscillospiraceae bacterium]|jgi:DNA-directed RNA polymerase specialized sigma24 family protein|nr:hypothetical protein [Oscillospiraceae bacterium]